MGHAYVELRGLTNRLERDIDRALDPAVKRLGKNISENISDSIERGFNDVDASDLQLDVGQAGDEAGRRLKEQIEDNLRDRIKLNVDVDIDRAVDDIDLFVAYVQERVRDIDVRITPPRWDEDDFKIVPHIDDSSMAEVKQRMDDLKSEYKDMEAELHPGIDFASSRYVSARMARMTRPRFATIFPVVDPASARLANNILDALAAGSGLRMTLNTLENIWDMFKNLDKNIPSITLWTTAITGLSAWVTTLVSDAAHLIVELGRIAGVAIPLPGIFAGLAIGIGASVAVLRDFSAVLPEVGAQFSALQRQMSSNFWSVAKRPIEDMINTLLPEFGAGLERISTNLGYFFGTLSTSLSNALSDEIAPMFDNLGRSINISTGYVDEFAGIIEVLGRHGSEYLPRLATWFGDISTRFNNFLRDAEKSGELQKWTDQGIANMGYLGKAIWGVGRIFYELGTIAEEAGGASLKSFSEGLNGIADIIGREPFRSNLRRVFYEAHEAISTIVDMSGPAVTKFFENFASIVADTFRTLAPAIGSVLRDLANALSSPEFTQGFANFVEGIGTGVEALSRSFGPLGAALGSVGTIIGEMASRFGPILADVLISLAELVIKLEQPIITIVDVLSDMFSVVAELPAELLVLTAIFAKFGGPIIAATKALMGFAAAAKLQAVLGGTNLAMGALGAAATGAQGAVMKFTGASAGLAAIAWPIAAITATAVAVGGLLKVLTRNEAVPHVNDIKNSILELAETGGSVNDLEGAFENFGTVLGLDTVKSVNSATDAFDKLLDPSVTDRFAGFLDGILPVDGYMEKIEERAELLDDSLSQLLQSGEIDAVDAYIAALEEQGYTMEEINRLLPKTAEAYADGTVEAHRNAEATEEAARAQEEAEKAHREVSSAIDTQVSSLGELIGLQRKAAGEILSTRDAQRGLEESFDKAAEAIEANGKTLDITTEKGRNNQAALDNIASSTYDLAEAMYQSGESTEDVAERVDTARKSFISMAEDMGMSSTEAKALANDLGLIPEKIVAEISADADTARYNLEGFLVEVNKTSGEVTIDAEAADGRMTLGELIGDINSADGTVTINGHTYPAETTISAFHNWIAANGGFEMPGDVDLTGAEYSVDHFVTNPQGMQIPVDADPSSAEASIDHFVTNPQGMQIPVDANPELAQASVDHFVMNPQGMMIPVDADPSPAEASVDHFVMSPYGMLIPVDAETTQAQATAQGLRDTVAQKPASMEARLDTLPVLGAVQALQNSIDSVDADIDITATTSGVATALTQIGRDAANASPQVSVRANTDLADSTLGIFVNATNRAHGEAEIRATHQPASLELRNYIRDVNRAFGEAEIRADDDPGRRALTFFENHVKRSSPSANVDASASLARGEVNTFIANTNNRVATVTVRTRRVEANADGNFYQPLQAFARGGIRRAENHVAQIARGGVTRIWAEPETGGEAYIPLARSKRSRSLRILEQVAQYMGQQIIPIEGRSVRKFAQGGILSRRDVSLLSRSASNNGTMGASARVATVSQSAQTQPVQITNNFTINDAGNVDVHTLAREVSREIMFKMK